MEQHVSEFPNITHYREVFYSQWPSVRREIWRADYISTVPPFLFSKPEKRQFSLILESGHSSLSEHSVKFDGGESAAPLALRAPSSMAALNRDLTSDQHMEQSKVTL